MGKVTTYILEILAAPYMTRYRRYARSWRLFMIQEDTLLFQDSMPAFVSRAWRSASILPATVLLMRTFCDKLEQASGGENRVTLSTSVSRYDRRSRSPGCRAGTQAWAP